MVRCETCPPEDVLACVFVVTFSRYRDGWLFSRHRERDTWETQGGHVEPDEAPEAAARRELYEEAGARAAAMHPVCGYWAERDGGARRYGMVYLAEIDEVEPLPLSEIDEARWFETLPAELTYPEITPALYARACEKLKTMG